MSERRTADRIGDLLVRRGVITARQLEQALALQRSSGIFLGALLVGQGWVAPEALLEALSEQFGIPIERLAPERIDWALAAQFPASVLAEGRCFPLRATEQAVTVAIINPLDVAALSTFERAARFRKVAPVLVLEQELQAVVRAWRVRSLADLTSKLDEPEAS
jgi:hypothetical protein